MTSAPSPGASATPKGHHLEVLRAVHPTDQRAAAVIPAQLDELRKKQQRLRKLFGQLPEVPGDLAALAARLGPLAGLDADTALPWLAAFAAEGASGTRAAGALAGARSA